MRDVMERVTFRIPADQLDDLDAHVEDGEFPSRSEAIRTAIDEQLLDGDAPTDTDADPTVADMMADGGTVLGHRTQTVQCVEFPHDCAFTMSASTADGVREGSKLDAYLNRDTCPDCGNEVVRLDV